MLRFLLFSLVMSSPIASVHAADVDPFDQSGVPIEEQPSDPKAIKIVLIAGIGSTKLKSGEHEYFAGVAILAKLLKQTPGVAPVIVRDGWPKKPETLKGAKAVVLFLEGGDVHTALKADRFEQLARLAEQGVGIVSLHSAIDYPKDLGERVRGWSGACWEKGYSQRAHWVAEFKTFPDHAICQGVTPFKIDDGWLFKLRFAEAMNGVTPLLKTQPLKSTMKLSDADTVISWAYEGTYNRGFAFTGCHLHESLQHEGYRRFLTNGILWAAHVDIPKVGAPVALEANDLKRYFDKRNVAKK